MRKPCASVKCKYYPAQFRALFGLFQALFLFPHPNPVEAVAVRVFYLPPK